MGTGPVRATVLTAALLGTAALTACEPPLPRVQIVVDTTQSGGDDVPGDGVCASSLASGSCTLQAAIEEGNTNPEGTDITVAAGNYSPLAATVTGDIRINWGAPQDVWLHIASFDVAAGASLSMSGINARSSSADITLWPPTVTTAGKVQVDHSVLTSLVVQPTGVAFLTQSIVYAKSAPWIDDAGTVVSLNSSILGNSLMGGTMVNAPGAVHLSGSVVTDAEIRFDGTVTYPSTGATCAGSLVSHGYVHTDGACATAASPTDSTGAAGIVLSYQATAPGAQISLDPTSPLIDAIPIGEAGCDVNSTDVFGNPRGVDGNGDGTPGCDIGAIEYQPPAAA